jgi:hypothetical protein
VRLICTYPKTKDESQCDFLPDIDLKLCDDWDGEEGEEDVCANVDLCHIPARQLWDSIGKLKGRVETYNAVEKTNIRVDVVGHALRSRFRHELKLPACLHRRARENDGTEARHRKADEEDCCMQNEHLGNLQEAR